MTSLIINVFPFDIFGYFAFFEFLNMHYIPAYRLVTTKGHQLKTFIASEDDTYEQKSNDDKILETALNLCKTTREELRGKSSNFTHFYFTLLQRSATCA